MKNRLLVCVDFGSSYTKVAIRIGWDGFTVLADNWPMASEELTFCIPSVVAKVWRGSESEWLVGIDAANQPPGDGVTIYRNWKATLFDKPLNEITRADAQSSSFQSSSMQSLSLQSSSSQSSASQSSASQLLPMQSLATQSSATQSSSSQSSSSQLLAAQSPATQSSSPRPSTAPAFDPEVGIAFFSALRRALRERSSLLDRDDIPVRICIPKFGSVELAESRLASVLEQSGLLPAVPRPTVFEPESNELGILSRGNNATWLPKAVNFMPWKGREVDLPRMLDSMGLRAAFRHMRDYFGFLVIDIGFFTTDFGYVRFDTSFSTGDWNKPAIIQTSVALGIQDLDRMVRKRLSDDARNALEELSTTQWDALKANLYQGLSVVVNNPDGSALEIGSGHDGDAVRESIQQFAEKVWDARQEFCAASLEDRVHAQVVTGGGSMIGGIKDLLATRSSAEMENNGDDFVSTMAPIFKRVSKHSAEAASPEVRARRDTQLVRGGSAIGGASVFFE